MRGLQQQNVCASPSKILIKLLAPPIRGRLLYVVFFSFFSSSSSVYHSEYERCAENVLCLKHLMKSGDTLARKQNKKKDLANFK